MYPAYPAGSSRAARPPLLRRISTRRWIAVDFVVAGFAALCNLAVLGRELRFSGDPWFPAALLLAVAVSAPIALRRRAPIPSLGALLILALLLSGMRPVVLAVIFLATAYVLYTVTALSSRRTGAAALGLVLVTMVISAVAGRGGGNTGAVEGAAFVNIITWTFGYSVRQRRLYVVRLQHQAASSAVAEERLRIARELHDVVAHSMSVIAVQAGYGQYVIDTSPDGARDALGAIQATSRDALEEMRRMLGVLRQQDIAPVQPLTDPAGSQGPTAAAAGSQAAPAGTAGGAGAGGGAATGNHAGGGSGAGRGGLAPLAPAPGLADLDRLIKRTGGAGIRVSLHVSGQVRPVPAGIDLSAYRIIQEALTNVVKHSGSARCTVSLGYGSGVLDVRVIDDGGPSVAVGVARIWVAGTPVIGAGHGIIGMRERVNLCGGTFKAGPLAQGGFLVAATLPLPLPTADVRAVKDADDASPFDSAVNASPFDSAADSAAVGRDAVDSLIAGHGGGQA